MIDDLKEKKNQQKLDFSLEFHNREIYGLCSS